MMNVIIIFFRFPLIYSKLNSKSCGCYTTELLLNRCCFSSWPFFFQKIFQPQKEHWKLNVFCQLRKYKKMEIKQEKKIVKTYLRWLFHILNTTNAIATKMPQPETVLMHTNNDSDTVRRTRRTIVRSCGICNENVTQKSVKTKHINIFFVSIFVCVIR